MPRDRQRSNSLPRSQSPRRHAEHDRDDTRSRRREREITDPRESFLNRPSRSLSANRSRSRSPARKRRRGSTSRSRSRSRHRKRKDKSRSRSRDRKERRRGDSDSSSSSGDERHRKDKRKEKSKDGKRARSKERKKEKRREKKEKKEKKKRTAEGNVPHWGKFGIISDLDMYNKSQEFHTWLVEERKINPETISKDQQKKEFARFVEDFNTATLPHEKYYNMESYDRRMTALRQGEYLPPADDSYNPEADMKALSGAHKKKHVERDTYMSKEQLLELRKVQQERIEAGKMRLLGMDVKQNMGVRMDGTMFDD